MAPQPFIRSTGKLSGNVAVQHPFCIRLRGCDSVLGEVPLRVINLCLIKTLRIRRMNNLECSLGFGVSIRCRP